MLCVCILEYQYLESPLTNDCDIQILSLNKTWGSKNTQFPKKCSTGFLLDLPMTLMAVMSKSSGKQSWKESWVTLSDGTVILSFTTEFIFISQSEAGLSFSMWSERPLCALRSTLHDTIGNSAARHEQLFYGHTCESAEINFSQSHQTAILSCSGWFPLKEGFPVMCCGVMNDSAVTQSQSSPNLRTQIWSPLV